MPFLATGSDRRLLRSEICWLARDGGSSALLIGSLARGAHEFGALNRNRQNRRGLHRGGIGMRPRRVEESVRRRRRLRRRSTAGGSLSGRGNLRRCEWLGARILTGPWPLREHVLDEGIPRSEGQRAFRERGLGRVCDQVHLGSVCISSRKRLLDKALLATVRHLGIGQESARYARSCGYAIQGSMTLQEAELRKGKYPRLHFIWSVHRRIPASSSSQTKTAPARTKRVRLFERLCEYG